MRRAALRLVVAAVLLASASSAPVSAQGSPVTPAPDASLGVRAADVDDGVYKDENVPIPAELAQRRAREAALRLQVREALAMDELWQSLRASRRRWIVGLALSGAVTITGTGVLLLGMDGRSCADIPGAICSGPASANPDPWVRAGGALVGLGGAGLFTSVASVVAKTYRMRHRELTIRAELSASGADFRVRF